MARPFIPKTIADCTGDWLTQILREAGLLSTDVRVSRVSARTLGEGEGFMGAVARLELEYDGDAPDAPASLIAKVPSQHRKTKAEGELLGLYEREIFFYQELGGALEGDVPRCYFSQMDPNPSSPEDQARILALVDKAPWWLLRILSRIGRWLARLSRRRYVLLLEDLDRGRVGDQVAGGQADDLRAMVTALANLHARFWQSEVIESFHWLPRLDTAARPIQLMYRDAIPEFRRRFSTTTSETILRLQDWLSDHWLDLVPIYVEAPLTLLHGDYRLDNVFFVTGQGDEPSDTIESVVAFDWQIPSKGPGAYDLAYLLISTMSPQAPSDQVDEMLALYHSGLREGGVVGYSREELERDYGYSLLMHVQRLTPSLTGIEVTNERGRTLQRVWIERLAAAVEGLDPDRLFPGRGSAAASSS
jgi:Ser/Thr protein kinase RdoA (MazF antagonist)